MSAACVRKSKAIPRICPLENRPRRRVFVRNSCGITFSGNRFTFLALLLSVLVAVYFFAERALREEYTRTTLGQLESIARLAKAQPPPLSSVPPSGAEDRAALDKWVSQMAASGVRVTVITADGQVLADSQSETRTMESHAIGLKFAPLWPMGGQAKRRSVTVGRDLLYYAIRSDAAIRPPLVLRFAAPLTVHETLVAFRRKLWFASVIILLLASTASLLLLWDFRIVSSA